MPEEEGGAEVQKETQEEAPISEWGIGRVKQRLTEIKEFREQMKEPLPEKEFEKLLDESHQLNARKKELLSVGTREAVNIARLIKDGTLRNEDIERAFKRIEQTYPDNTELQEANFDLVRAEYAKLERIMEEKPKEEAKKKEGETTSPEAAVRRLEEIQAEIAKIHAKPSLTKDDAEKLQEFDRESKALYEILASVPKAELAAFPGMERMPAAIPPVERIGPVKYEEEFDKRLFSLIEENIDQSFDANWRLVYPLETAIAILRPEYGKPDNNIFEGEKYSYSELRKKLATKLAAFRACHNHNYLHTRVERTTDLISAANLLSVESIEYLLRMPEIAEALRQLEDWGEEYQSTDQKRDKETLFSKIKKLTRENWKGIVAGNLFKGLGEAARMDIILDNAGDFFLARIFNVKDRALSDWEKKWGRHKEFSDLCEAVDLEVLPFWMKALTDYRKKLKDRYGKEESWKRFQDFCQRKGVKVEEKDIDKYGNIISASLKSARFETMELGIEGIDPMGLSSNELTRTHLGIDDAENVRKLIINPGGLLQIPRLGILTRDINVVFKHLKGEHRYEWFRRVTKAVVDYYKDRRAPSVEENFPDGLRSSISKSDFPDVVPWTWQYTRSQVEAMGPVLRRKEMDQILKETIGTGWKAKVEGKKVVSAVGAGILRGAGEFLGSLFKGIFGGK